MSTSLEPRDRVIMISGANRGIVATVAARLGEAGYALSLGIRSPAERERVEALKEPETCMIAAYDAAEIASAGHWVDATVARYGRIDGLVNAAGVLLTYDFEKDEEDILETLLEVNLKGPLRLMRHAFPYLRQAGSGRVVNIVSLSGLRVKGLSSGYAMSKFAAHGLSHSARFAGWDDGIRVTALCPGWVNTEMVAHNKTVPPDEMTQPETIAETVHFLLSLPNNASIATLPINCVLEGTY